MTFSVIENARGYFGSRPPLVAFMIFLASMAVGLITFAYFVSDMPKAVVNQEFNQFVERLSALNLCVGEERGGLVVNTTTLPSAAMGAGKASSVERMKQANTPMKREMGPWTVSTSTTSSSTSSADHSFNVNVSMAITLEVEASAYFQSLVGHRNTSTTTTTITTSLWASQLGRAGLGHETEANLTMVLFPYRNRSHPCQHLGRRQCYRVGACLTITAPRHFFPHKLHPDMFERCHRKPEQGRENHLHGQIIQGFERCVNASLVHLQYIYDSANHAVMVMNERSAINLHLMHSSYFLFVMVISLFCYAIIRGRPAKVKAIHIQSTSDKQALIQA